MQQLGIGFGLKGLLRGESAKVMALSLFFSFASLGVCTVLLMVLPEPWDIPPAWMGEVGPMLLTAVFMALKALIGLILWLVLFRFLTHLFLGSQLSRLIDTVIDGELQFNPLLPDPPMWASTAQAIRFLIKTCKTHVVCFPIYLVCYLVGFTLPLVPLMAFWWVDGKLLTREYFLLVGPRFIPAPDLEAQWEKRKNGLRLWGIFMSFLMTWPFINMLVPLFATYSMVYVLGRRTEP